MKAQVPQAESQKARITQAALFIAIWMALGWVLHLASYEYLLLGIPLCLVFQFFVARRPLSSCWVRDTTTIEMDWSVIVFAVAFMVVPVWNLIAAWSSSSWALRLYYFGGITGAVGVGFALRHFNVKAVGSLFLCLCTAGVLGCAVMLLPAYGQHHGLRVTSASVRLTLNQFLVILPVCFVMEEVAFRGILDSHVHHPQDSRPWLSALLLSMMWGWWHLPISRYPTSAPERWACRLHTH